MCNRFVFTFPQLSKQASPSRSPDPHERACDAKALLDPNAVDAQGFPTIFRLALGMGAQMGPTMSDDSDSVLSVPETAPYDSDGFPRAGVTSRQSFGDQGQTPTEAKIAPEKSEDEPEAVTPSSRIRSTALAKSTLKKPRGRPKKIKKPSPSPKTPKRTKNASQAKQSKGTKDCKSPKAAGDAGPFSSVCCCVCQGKAPRAELTAMAATAQGSKHRVYLFTLTLANWGPSFAEDAHKFKVEIESKSLTKKQALELRDSHRGANAR
jgi:hypothetical protein